VTWVLLTSPMSAWRYKGQNHFGNHGFGDPK
jgi:hypothetical protein